MDDNLTKHYVYVLLLKVFTIFDISLTKTCMKNWNLWLKSILCAYYIMHSSIQTLFKAFGLIIHITAVEICAVSINKTTNYVSSA